MNNLLQDFRYAIRQMRRSPGFAVTAILILTLGIAANVIVFGVLEAVVLRPVDVPQPERLMTLSHAQADKSYPFFSYPEVRDVRDAKTVFSAVGAFSIQNFGLDANGVTRPVWGLEVGGEYFEAAAVKPFLGRLLQRSDDDHPGASDAAVLSWSVWNGYFGADPNVVGQTMHLNKHPYTIVGVTPESYNGTEKIVQPGVFVPIANQASLDGVAWLEARRQQNVWAIVRLKDGVTVPQAKAELERISAQVRARYPDDEEKLAFSLARTGMMGDFLGAPAGAFLAGVMGLAAIVLLAACANLGSLFVARTVDRTREIAIRMAIGSSRWRVVRQVVVEAVVIAVCGGICAGSLAWTALTSLAAWHPPTEYPLTFGRISPQPSLLLMALLISVLAGVLFGVMPLRQIFGTDPNAAIKGGGSQTRAGHRWALRDMLLAGQIALCCVTVTAAFVSVRGLGNAVSMDLGFKPARAVIAKFELSQAGYSGETANRFQRQILERISRLPGVAGAGYANSTPLNQDVSAEGVYLEQSTDFRPSAKAFQAYVYDVSPGYFNAAGTQLLAGRDIGFADTDKTPEVAVVNREFARRLVHSLAPRAEDAVGRYFKSRSGVSVRIVGLVEDGKYLLLNEEPAAAAFYPILQHPSTKTALIVRVQPDSPAAAVGNLAAAVRKTVRDLDVSVPIRESSGWNSQLGLTFFVSRVATAALGVFGAFGLLLSVAGTFGLASYTVGRRLRELSIRVALGAEAKQVLSAALGRMLILIGGGCAVGIALGAAASKLLAAIVYQASPKDPFVLGAVALTMAVTGALSVAGPVRRALDVDPAVLLREQ